MKTFSKFLSWVVAFAAVCAFVPGQVRAEDVRVSKPTVLGLELFGRGILYTIQAEEMLSEELSAGVGFGTVGLKGPSGNLDTSAKLLPVYVNYYFMNEQGSLFATASASLVMNQSQANGNTSTIGNVKFSNSGVQPAVGVGYENRSPTGAMLRMTAYGIFASRFCPWFGAAIGYAF